MNGDTPSARALQESLEAFFPWLRAARGDESALPGDGPPPDPAADLRDEIESLQRQLSDLSNRFPRRPQ
jgi:hypothetical protein